MEDDVSESGDEWVADKSVQWVSLKERLAEIKVKAAGNDMDKNVNAIFGYMTSMSMKNKDT